MIKLYLNKLRINLEVLISVIIVLSCIYNYVKASEIMCKLDRCLTQTTETLLVIFPRSVAIASSVSRITAMYKSKNAAPKYKKKIEEYEFYFPISIEKKKCRRIFVAVIIFFYVSIILPINLYRLYLISRYNGESIVIFFFFFIYIQNWSLCITEIQFIHCCFGLYQKFQLINEEMFTLKSITIIKNRYPLVLKSKESTKNSKIYSSEDFLWKTKQPSFDNCIELLKFRHQFVSNSITDLNELYGVQVGVSISVLFIMSLFDIYEVVTTKSNVTKTYTLLYGWMLQYTSRFCAIVLTTHVTTRQVNSDNNL